MIQTLDNTPRIKIFKQSLDKPSLTAMLSKPRSDSLWSELNLAIQDRSGCETIRLNVQLTELGKADDSPQFLSKFTDINCTQPSKELLIELEKRLSATRPGIVALASLPEDGNGGRDALEILKSLANLKRLEPISERKDPSTNFYDKAALLSRNFLKSSLGELQQGDSVLVATFDGNHAKLLNLLGFGDIQTAWFKKFGSIADKVFEGVTFKAFRPGGDEFVVIVKDTGDGKAFQAISRFFHEINKDLNDKLEDASDLKSAQALGQEMALIRTLHRMERADFRRSLNQSNGTFNKAEYLNALKAKAINDFNNQDINNAINNCESTGALALYLALTCDKNGKNEAFGGLSGAVTQVVLDQDGLTPELIHRAQGLADKAVSHDKRKGVRREFKNCDEILVLTDKIVKRASFDAEVSRAELLETKDILNLTQLADESLDLMNRLRVGLETPRLRGCDISSGLQRSSLAATNSVDVAFGISTTRQLQRIVVDIDTLGAFNAVDYMEGDEVVIATKRAVYSQFPNAMGKRNGGGTVSALVDVCTADLIRAGTEIESKTQAVLLRGTLNDLVMSEIDERLVFNIWADAVKRAGAVDAINLIDVLNYKANYRGVTINADTEICITRNTKLDEI